MNWRLVKVAMKKQPDFTIELTGLLFNELDTESIYVGVTLPNFIVNVQLAFLCNGFECIQFDRSHVNDIEILEYTFQHVIHDQIALNVELIMNQSEYMGTNVQANFDRTTNLSRYVELKLNSSIFATTQKLLDSLKCSIKSFRTI